MKTLAAASIMLVIAGAAAASGTAVIRIDRSKSPPAAAWWVPPAGQKSHFSEFRAFDNERCANGERSSLWRDKKAASVDAGHPIYIRAFTAAMYSESNVLDPIRCVQVIRFTPEAGHSYTLSQEVLGGKCPVRLVDDASQAPPESFSVVPTYWTCKPE
jgi:hypothetical protein